MPSSTPSGDHNAGKPFTPLLKDQDPSQSSGLTIVIPEDVDSDARSPSSANLSTPVTKNQFEQQNAFSPRDFSPSNFDSVLHLPSPLVTDSSWDTSRSARSNFIDRIKDARRDISSELQVNKTRNTALSPPKRSNFARIASEFKSSEVISHPQLASAFKAPKARNFSSPLTSAYDTHLEKTKIEKEEKLDIDEDAELSDYYSAYTKNGDLVEYKVLRKIGKGSFSVVLLAEDQLNQKVAIKISTVPDAQQTRARVESSMKRELDLLKDIDHPNVIKILAYKTIDEVVVIVMPYCLGGDLYSFASSYRPVMKPQLVRKMFANLVSAVRFLHHHDIVHRDIKLENVLLNFYQDELLELEEFAELPPLVVLTDFGLSKRLDSPTQLLTTRCGSEDYVSPELMMGIPYDGKKNDVWAVGVLLYSLIEGRLPFDPIPATANSHISSASQRMKQTSAHRIALIDWGWYNFKNGELVDNYDEWKGAMEIVDRCLVRKDKRCSIDDIAEAEWIKSYI